MDEDIVHKIDENLRRQLVEVMNKVELVDAIQDIGGLRSEITRVRNERLNNLQMVCAILGCTSKELVTLVVSWRWKPKINETYWFITGSNTIIRSVWTDTLLDNEYFKFGNCFRTREEAEAMAEKVKKLLKGE